MLVEIAIRVNGEVEWIEVDPQFLKGIKGTIAKASPTPTDEDFNEWWNLYDKKTSKKETISYWKRHITKDDYDKIISHTKNYIIDRPKVYRKDPIRYLKHRIFEDEIVLPEKKVDINELYPLDKTGNSRLGRCSSCNGTVFGNKFTIASDDSDCCKAKINKYR